jgi:sarcosine oxidase
LDLAPVGATIGLDDYRASMTAAGVGFEELDAGEVMRRWPQWQLSDDVTALFQEQSGIAMASRANSAHRRLAVDNGATLVEGSEVGRIREVDGEVELIVGGRPVRVGSLVVAAGAWTAPVLDGLGVRLPLEVTQEQVVYLASPDLSSFHPSRFPIWIWMDEPSFYGFPVFGEPAVKIAWDRCEIVTEPDTRSFEPRADVNEAVTAFSARHLPGAVGPVHVAKTCLYTLTPDRDFVLGPVGGHDRVLVALGAAHGFKFAPLLGRVLADLALHDGTDVDIGPFAPDRPALTAPGGTANYLV